MGKISKKLQGRSSIGAIIALVLVAVLALWIWQLYQSGGTVAIFGIALPAWLVYGVAGALIIAVVAKFIRQYRMPLSPLVDAKFRGAVSGFLALIMLFLAMLIVVTYALNFFGLSWSTVLSYAALMLAVLVIIVLLRGKSRGLSGITAALVLLVIVAVGAAAYYVYSSRNYAYAIYAAIAATAITALAVFLHRHRGQDVVVLEE